jgi:antitoxin HicB
MPKSTKKPLSKKRSAKSSAARPAKPSPDDYQMVALWSAEDACYVVTLPAWQGARTHGATLTEAMTNAREVLQLLINSALKHGEPIPRAERRYSGNLRLRLPTSLHGRLALEAEREGVSLNQWIVARLAS